MNLPSTSSDAGNQPSNACFARVVADALAEEPTLEAVTIDRTHQKISVATLGRSDAEKLSARITTQFEQVSGGSSCLLLSGSGDCLNCETPLTQQERKNITIQHTSRATTIARVTCPTAPRF